MIFDEAPCERTLSPWLIGCAVGGGAALLSFIVDEGPLPLKLFGALSTGCFSALGSAARNAKKRHRRQDALALRARRAEQPRRELPAGTDFRSDIGRRSAIAARARFEAKAYDSPANRPLVTAEGRSPIDIRCEELERSLGSSRRHF